EWKSRTRAPTGQRECAPLTRMARTHCKISNSCRILDNRILQDSYLVDFRYDLVAGSEKFALCFADTVWGAGRDDVARLERDIIRDECDHRGHRKHHFGG